MVNSGRSGKGKGKRAWVGGSRHFFDVLEGGIAEAPFRNPITPSIVFFLLRWFLHFEADTICCGSDIEVHH